MMVSIFAAAEMVRESERHQSFASLTCTEGRIFAEMNFRAAFKIVRWL